MLGIQVPFVFRGGLILQPVRMSSLRQFGILDHPQPRFKGEVVSHS